MSDATPDWTNAWATFLREQTDRPGWSVARLAREAGVHRSTIFRWLKGDAGSVTIATVQKIAQALGVDEEIALRAAGDIVEREPAEDEESIRLIMSSEAPADVKEELVREIRRMQRQHADERASIAQRLLDVARRVRGAT